MKKILLVALAFATVQFSSAQVETPQPSPASKMEQKVGLTDVTVNYSRPGVKGRTIFGDLVPYGKVWRTGANKNTTISFSDDVMIGGKELKAGEYALFTKPNAGSWDIYFYTDTNNWGAPRKWDDAKVALTTTAKVEKLPFNVETFMILITNIKTNGASLEFVWENVMVEVPFTVPTDKKAVANIEKVMAGPSANDYFDSATFYYDNGKDINKAKMWIEKAVELSDKPRFWYIHTQALIYKKAGDKKAAKKAAERSLALAKEAKYDAYIKKNEDLLKTL
ncbi:DUF2911 domain-containing protein [Pseudofulvibacter geojedonensis]|uniref:DUF2911 domain-containing protein n=1 Tax=Pseudofulvibacter geojedonensis TaxID=1123758 RepID=A0ABW3I3A6_9FLAO